MHGLLHDLRFAVRMLRRNPGVTLAATFSLALGVGANAAIFSLVDAVLFDVLPVAGLDRLVTVYRTDEEKISSLSHPELADLERATRSELAGLAAEVGARLNLATDAADGPGAERLRSAYVTVDYFDVLGLEPAAGRFFLPEEGATRGTHPVAVVAETLWRRRWAADPGIVGREIRLNGRPFTVIGVAPRGFGGSSPLHGSQVWVPVEMLPTLAVGRDAELLDDRDAGAWNVIGRLAPGATPESAAAEVAAIARALDAAHPDGRRERGMTVRALADVVPWPEARPLFERASAVLMAAVGLVLLVACVNVANLLLARAFARRHEIALRLSLGAGRGRLVRQLLTESLVLALLGAGGGWLLAVWCRGALWSIRPPWMRHGTLDLSPDLRVVGFTAAITLLATVVCGVAPALQSLRLDLAGQLRERGGGRAEKTTRPLRAGLLAAQVAFCFTAVAMAALFLQSLHNADQVDRRIPEERLLFAGVDLASAGHTGDEARRFLDRLLRDAAARPEITVAAAASQAPIAFYTALRVVPRGAEDAVTADGVEAFYAEVSDDYFTALELAVVSGRAFGPADGPESRPVAVVNREMAARFWPDGAVGRELSTAAHENPLTVVGVVETMKYQTLGEAPKPAFFVPLRQGTPGFVHLHLRTARDPADAVPALRRVLAALDPDLPLTHTMTIDEYLDGTVWVPALGAKLLGAFGLLAIVLAAIGLWGVLAQVVAERRREVGIRLALGADRRRILRFVFRLALAPVALGMLAGLAGAVATGRLARGLLYGLDGIGPAALAVAVTLLGAVAVAATWGPAARSARVDPATTLRAE